MIELSMSPVKRAMLFGSLAAAAFVFSRPLVELLQTRPDVSSHIPVLFLLAGYILRAERKKIFTDLRFSALGIVPVLLSPLPYLLASAHEPVLARYDQFSWLYLSLAIFISGTFWAIFGPTALRKAAFPVVLLFLATPIPGPVLDEVIFFLQSQSFSAAAWILDRLHFFPQRDGFVLTLPQISVEVARQCSGIRSSIALLIISLLCGHYYLRTFPGKASLAVFAVLAAPFKNGVRIVALMLLAIYWDPQVFSGPLHTGGGILFFTIGLAWLLLIMVFLMGAEKAFCKYWRRTGSQADLRSR